MHLPHLNHIHIVKYVTITSSTLVHSTLHGHPKCIQRSTNLCQISIVLVAKDQDFDFNCTTMNKKIKWENVKGGSTRDENKKEINPTPNNISNVGIL